MSKPEVDATKPHPVKVFVNRKSVELPRHEATGAEIKAAAEVPADFQLFRRHDSNLVRVADDEELRLHEDEHFIAVSGQDVS